MPSQADLAAICTPPSGELEDRQPSRLWRALGRWSPFVFPWSGLQSMTGVVISSAGLTLAHGRLHGRRFRIKEIVHRPGPDVAGCLEDLGSRHDGPACISLPRSRTLVRHFRVPADSEAEIQAMLPHLLASELPLAIENFSWIWSGLPAAADGYSLVTVYVSRNDQLEAFLAPLVEAGLNVVNLVPEGLSWARVLGSIGGAGDEDVEPVNHTFVIQVDGAPYLLVERDGQLLFDMVLPAPTGPSAAPPHRGDDVDEDGPGIAEARERFADLFDAPLPPPRYWPEDAADKDEGDQMRRRFAAAVASGGLDQGRSLLPPAQSRLCRRRTLREAVFGLVRLGLAAALIWLALTAWADGRTRRHLAALEAEVAAQASTVAVLEAEYAAIRESSLERAAGTRIFPALTSLRRHVKPPIYLEHLNYVQGQGVTLRGGAPANEHVLEMMERLTTDPLWRSLRVMQLKSEKTDGVDRVHFVVEGRLD